MCIHISVYVKSEGRKSNIKFFIIRVFLLCIRNVSFKIEYHIFHYD